MDAEADSTRKSLRTEANYNALQRRIDLPITLLALVLGVILAVQFFFDLAPETDSTLERVGWIIWAVFVVEYLVLLLIAPDRRRMVTTHKLDLFLILVPFLRPLRILRLVRSAAGLAAFFVTARRVMTERGLQWIIFIVTAVIFAAAALTMAAERQDPEATITNFGTALWWAIVTCTTVGYGDHSPVTPAGQGIAVVLMLVGIALLSIITANIASLFVEQDVQEENEALRAELDSVNAKLDELLQRSSDVNPTS